MSLYSSLSQVLAPFAAKINGLLTGYDGTTYETPGEAVRTQINDLHVLIGHEPGTVISGSAISYDNTDSGMTATDVQSALDETNERLTVQRSEQTAIQNDLFDYTERTVASATAQGWRLKGSGICESNADYKLVKFRVVENTLIKVVSDDKFQFQTSATVPSGGENSNLVGVTYSAGEYVLEVPTTATYLIVSTPTISASSVYAVNSRIETVEKSYEFGGNNLFDPSYLETLALFEREGNEYIGTPKMLNDVFASASYPITFEAGKQYAITMEAYHEGDPASGSFGLVFAFLYSDGTNSGNDGCAFENTRVSWTRRTAISDPTKDVVGLIIPGRSNVNWTWHIRNVMVIEGSDPLQFFPYATAKDTFLRADPYIDFSVINPGGKGGSVGSAILVRFPSGKRMLMDTHVTGYGVYNGADGGFTKQLQARSMTSKVRIDYLIISHYHADHVGGLLDWIDNDYLTNGKIDIYGATVFLPPEITVSNLSGISSDDPATLVERQTKVVTALTEQNCTIIRPTEGQTINIGEAVIRFVNCDHSVYYPNGSYQTNNYNDFSLCNYIEYGSQTFFCTADIGYIAETYLATLPNSLLKSTFMTAPHHGWQADGDGVLGANKLIPDFINRVCPDVVISQNGATHAPDSGNPPSMINSSSAVQTWCERNGVSNYATCLNGTIDFAMYKHGWKFAGSYIRYIRNGKNWSYSDNSEHIES